MLAIGRMCALSDNLHGKLAQPALLAECVKTIANAASPELLKASLYLLQSSVQTSAEAARLAVDAGALPWLGLGLGLRALPCLCERLGLSADGLPEDFVYNSFLKVFCIGGAGFLYWSLVPPLFKADGKAKAN